MSAARERIDGVLRHLRQRQEKEEQAIAAWQRARSHCLVIAKALLEGTDATVEMEDDRLLLLTKHQSRGAFVFERHQLAFVGIRYKNSASVETFFSLRIEPPPRPASAAEGQWGPGRGDGLADLTYKIGSQEAFEKAVADWFEWAYMGAGAPLAGT